MTGERPNKSSVHLNDAGHVATAFCTYPYKQQVASFNGSREVGDGYAVPTFSAPNICQQLLLDCGRNVCPQFRGGLGEFGKGLNADRAFNWYWLTSVSQARQYLSSVKEILLVTCFEGDIFHENKVALRFLRVHQSARFEVPAGWWYLMPTNGTSEAR